MRKFELAALKTANGSALIKVKPKTPIRIYTTNNCTKTPKRPTIAKLIALLGRILFVRAWIIEINKSDNFIII